MRFDLSNPYDLPRAREYFQKLVEQRAIVDITKKKEPHTIPQQKYLHLILGWFGVEIGMSLEQVKVDIYKRICNRELFEREHVNKRGKRVTYLRSTNDLTKDEYSLSITRFRNYASVEAEIYLPSSDERQFLSYIEGEMERYKEFI